MHEHGCEHPEVKYCGHCDLTYCVSCKHEWGRKVPNTGWQYPASPWIYQNPTWLGNPYTSGGPTVTTTTTSNDYIIRQAAHGKH